MRMLPYVLCGLCLAGGAVTSLAMSGFTPVDDKPMTVNPPRPAETTRSNRKAVFDDSDFPTDEFPGSNPFTKPQLPDQDRDVLGRENGFDELMPERNVPSRVPMRARQVRRTFIETHMEPVPAEELAAAEKLQEAIKSLNESSDPEVQKTATDTIQQQLSEQFDLDLKQREKELADVEAKVKSLREQLDKRKAARDDIISLRLKTITNDAAGLEFPGGNGANGPTEHSFSPFSKAPPFEPDLPATRTLDSRILVPSEDEYSDRTFTNPRGTYPETSPDTSRKPPLDPPTRPIRPPTDPS